MIRDLKQLDFQKGGGLIPAIIQDDRNRQVLMLGYFNEEALQQTLQEGRVTFYSRSKERLWTKGETSGNFLHVRSIEVDCDQDTLLVRVVPAGPVCHRGTTTCFAEETAVEGFLGELEEVVAARAEEPAEQSYTRRLLDKGPKKIGQKVGEEGVEIALEAEHGTQEDLLNESADMLYHLLVLWQARGLKLTDVERVLFDRHHR